jgi:hypothetical protein
MERRENEKFRSILKLGNNAFSPADERGMSCENGNNLEKGSTIPTYAWIDDGMS